MTVHLRFQRSTNTPAKNPIVTEGTSSAITAILVARAEPVNRYTKMGSVTAGAQSPTFEMKPPTQSRAKFLWRRTVIRPYFIELILRFMNAAMNCRQFARGRL